VNLSYPQAFRRHQTDNKPNNFPEKQHDFKFAFLALVDMSDSVRSTVAPAIAEVTLLIFGL
jgi:Ca2+-transporting ATPase